MKSCELCKEVARIYCESDQAVLCWDCDTKVHSANFLVAKHSRTLLCRACHSPTLWTGSGPNLGLSMSTCETCTARGLGIAADRPQHRQQLPEQNTTEEDDDEFEEEDDDDDEYDEDEIGSDDDETGDNQIVPWSSNPPPPPPPAASSSSSDEFFRRYNNGDGADSFKRQRNNNEDSDLGYNRHHN